MKRIVGLSIASMFSLQLAAQETPKAEAPQAETPKAEAPKAEAPKAEAPKAETSTAVKMRVRLDSLSQTLKKKSAAGTTTKDKLSGFRIKKADITFVNKVGDATIQLRLNPMKDSWSAESTSSDKGVASVLDQFWLDMPLAAGLSLRAGKLDTTLAGSYENLVDTSFDYYLKSYYGDTLIPGNPLGVDLSYKFAKNQVRFQVANGIETEKTTAVAADFTDDGGLSTSLAFFGDFGMVKPVASVSMLRYARDTHIIATDTHDHGNKGRTLMGVGAQIDVAGAAIAAEVNSGKIEGYDKVVATTKSAVKEQTLTNLTAQVKYPVGPVTPFLKLTSDSHKKNATANVGDMDRLGYSIGGSYNIMKNGRFDVVYNNIAKTTKAATGDDKETTTEFIVATALKI